MFDKGDKTNPKVGDTFYYIPSGGLFVVQVTIEEVYTQPTWTIECMWIDEPIGHAIYGWEELYKTLAGALSGLRAKKRDLANNPPPKGCKYSQTLHHWRQRGINSIGKSNPDVFKVKYKKKKIWK
jgi:hypothetical protein